MTGWRISEILSFRREDFDPKSGMAVLRAENTKNGNEEAVPLHPVVVEHLKLVASFNDVFFPWNHNRRTLDVEFHRKCVKVKDENENNVPLYLPCRGKHEHTDACHRYGFHDLRRAFATMNAALCPNALQRLMRHQSYQTTQLYVAMGRQLDDAVETLHVPDVLRVRAAN
jgi:integrase